MDLFQYIRSDSALLSVALAAFALAGIACLLTCVETFNAMMREEHPKPSKPYRWRNGSLLNGALSWGISNDGRISGSLVLGWFVLNWGVIRMDANRPPRIRSDFDMSFGAWCFEVDAGLTVWRVRPWATLCILHNLRSRIDG